MGKIIDANTPKGYPVMHKAALGRPQRSVPNGRARRSQIRCTRSARKRSPSRRPVEQRYTASRPAHSILELSRFSGHLPTPVGRSCSYYDRSLFRECLDSFRTRTAGCLAPLPAGPRAGSGELLGAVESLDHEGSRRSLSGAVHSLRCAPGLGRWAVLPEELKHDRIQPRRVLLRQPRGQPADGLKPRS